MVVRKTPWFGRVLKWHKMADGYGCAYRGRVYTIHKPFGENLWYFTTDPDDPGGERLTPYGGPGLARSLDRSRLLAEVLLLVDPADRAPGATDFGLAIAGAGFSSQDGRSFAVSTDAEQGLLRIYASQPVEGTLVAAVQPVFHHGGQITHWRTSGPDGTHWDNSAYWREACRLIEART